MSHMGESEATSRQDMVGQRGSVIHKGGGTYWESNGEVRATDSDKGIDGDGQVLRR